MPPPEDITENVYTIYYGEIESIYRTCSQGSSSDYSEESSSNPISTKVPLLDQLNSIKLPFDLDFCDAKPADWHTYCSAALIAASVISASNKRPYFCCMRIDTHQQLQGQVYRLDLVEELKLAHRKLEYEQIPKIEILQKDRICCIGFVGCTTDQKDFERGVCRYFCLVAVRWNKSNLLVGIVATAVIEVRDDLLAGLPSINFNHRVEIGSMRINFQNAGKHIIAAYYPSREDIPCMLIYCLYRSTFIPITGNLRNFPGCFVFRPDEFVIRAYDYKSLDNLLFLARSTDRHPDGRSSYQFCRLLLN